MRFPSFFGFKARVHGKIEKINDYDFLGAEEFVKSSEFSCFFVPSRKRSRSRVGSRKSASVGF